MGMQATQRSALGVAVGSGCGQLSAAVIVGATSLPLTSVLGTIPSSGFVTIYDGTNTETVALSAYAAPTATVAATAHAHPAGCLVDVTAAANAPTDYIPVTTFTPADNITQLEDKNYRGSMVDVYDLVEGPISGSYDTGGDLIPDVFGYVAGSMFGDITTTGATVPYTHVMAALNSGNGQPNWLTFTDLEPVQARAYPRMQCTDLSIMFDATKALSWTAKFIGFNSGTVGQPTKSFTTDRILPSWTGGTTIGGTYTPTLQSGQIDLKRTGTIISTLDGNQAPYAVWVGPVSATGKLTFVYQDETQLLNYLNNTQPSLVIDFTTGTGTGLREVKLQISRCAYSAAAKMRSGDFMTLDVSFTSVANTTDVGASGGYSPVKLTLQTSKVSGTY